MKKFVIFFQYTYIIGIFSTILYVFLIMWPVELFLDRHVLRYYHPFYGARLYDGMNCDRNLESFVIALQAYPHIYENANFGLEQPASLIENLDCQANSDGKYLNPDFRLKVLDIYQQKYKLSKKGFPSKIFHKYNKDMSITYYPSSLFGRIYYIYWAYKTVYDGGDFIHLLRCDASLLVEPYHTFLLSNIHSKFGIMEEQLEQRIAECGFEQRFRGEIGAILEREIGDMEIMIEK